MTGRLIKDKRKRSLSGTRRGTIPESFQRTELRRPDPLPRKLKIIQWATPRANVDQYSPRLALTKAGCMFPDQVRDCSSR